MINRSNIAIPGITLNRKTALEALEYSTKGMIQQAHEGLPTP
jgi:hypothetical protein